MTLLLLCALQESWVNPPKEGIPGVEHRTFASAALKKDVGYMIRVPADYGTSDKRYPAIFYLHGMTDCESTHPELFAVMAEAEKKGELPPTILVYAMGGRTSWFTDGEIPAETLIVKELIPHVDGAFRTVAGREGRGLIGWSMGGFGALKLATKHPSLFGAVVGLGGAYRTKSEITARPGPWYVTQFGKDPERYHAESPYAWVETNADALRGKTRISLWVGEKDFLLGSNRIFKAFLEARTIPFAYAEIPGIGHEPKKIFATAGLDILKAARP
jgi:enterochelin esterase-like enzyme